MKRKIFKRNIHLFILILPSFACFILVLSADSLTMSCRRYKMVQIWQGLIVCRQVTVCPGHIWTILYNFSYNTVYSISTGLPYPGVCWYFSYLINNMKYLLSVYNIWLQILADINMSLFYLVFLPFRARSSDVCTLYAGRYSAHFYSIIYSITTTWNVKKAWKRVNNHVILVHMKVRGCLKKNCQ
jgi:hypothetical protein